MKFLALVATLTLSVSAFAKAPAAQSVEKLLAAGTYYGYTSENEKCSVTVLLNDFVTVSITTENSFSALSLLESSNAYIENAATGEFSATQSMRLPRYAQGGTRYLNIRANGNTTDVYISEILLDHQGNDASTFLTCSVSK